MNIYIAGVLVGICIYLVIGFYAGKKVKNLEDYYVNGRKSTTLFITGTMFASMLSTNGFMGDTAYAYNGNITTIFLINILCACGYVLGPLYFGRFIRRAKVNTTPSYFSLRFNSDRIQRFAGIITVVSLSAYLLSVMSGTTILMEVLSGFDRTTCLFISWICILLFTVYSGSKGVVLIDTIMCLCFLSSTIFVGYFVFNESGGISNLIQNLISNPNSPKDLFSYHGNTGNGSAFDMVIYAITLGIVWMITVAVSPWQAGRNLMAKNEHVVFRSGVLSALLTTFFLLYLYIIAISVIQLNPNMAKPEQVIIWTAHEVVPKFLGVFLLTGILSAGLSSATTFLSVVSFSLANDIFRINFKNEKSQIGFTRKVVFVVSFIALILAYFDLASIRIIAWFASTIIASSWGFLAFASVWSKKITERGAYLSMLGGFFGYLISKCLVEFAGFDLKNLFDPFFIGLFLSVCLATIGSFGQKRTPEEIEFLNKLHEIPISEQNSSDYKIDRFYAYLMIASGIILTILLIIYWAVPYNDLKDIL
ncbi:Na+/solute symporter [Campylobacter pinnipediorum subsp. caledonicus]|uniref:Na+/solute symporter n=1 Tax=Campylobacter pinnipediorum subsp. caledonicus TaxID=1874362 RepID=A0A1S6U6M7_9BACT|nr:sodium:solute symporter family protein [Campylobacter pinnipediorum]AQW87332.1 Na+/solute symporter [Campylobacter pinnipediorum subsp. caledonicus]